MPDNKSALSRYRVIDRCLRNNMRPYPSKESIRDKCEFELFGEGSGKVSVSTIEKDLDAMRNDAGLGYFAPIKYHKVKKGYYYSEPSYSIEKLPLSVQEEDAIRFASITLYQYRDIPIFEHFREAIDKIYARLSLARNINDPQIDKLVQFEKTNGVAGLEWLQPVFHAIVNAHTISFEYDNVYKHEHKSFTMHPYLLKENRKKWYVLGYYAKHDNYLTFALDRICNLVVNEEQIRKRTDFDADLIFKYSTGIMGGKDKTIDILLEVKDPLSKLLQLHPMNATQKLVKETPEGIRVSMKAIDSPELLGQLLSFGSHLQVLKPKSLRDKIKAEAQKLMEANQ